MFFSGAEYGNEEYGEHDRRSECCKEDVLVGHKGECAVVAGDHFGVFEDLLKTK